MPNIEYPTTRFDSVIDDYHGHQIADPFRWLEDDHADDTKAWVGAQNEVTEEFLNKIPYRNLLQRRLEEAWNYERYGVPTRHGGKYYYFKNNGLQNQSVLYAQDDLSADARIVLDPNTFSEDGTVALAGTSFNKDGTLMAYQISDAGSDWRTIYVLDLNSGKPLDDEIKWVKFSGVSWSGNGFYYSRFPVPEENDALSGQNRYHKVYYHELGTPQTEDQLIIDDPDHPQRNFYAGTSDDEDFLYVSISESTSGNALKIRKTLKGSKWVTIAEDFSADYQVQDNVGDRIFIMTNHKAPNWKLVAVDLGKDESELIDIIPEQDQLLSDISFAGGKIFAEYLEDAKSAIKVFDYDGKLISDLALPGIGSVSGLQGKKDEERAFFSFTSYTNPSTIYSLSTDDLTVEIFKQPEVNIDLQQFNTEQVFYESKDGTRVPMFITYRKGMVRDGNTPTLLYGYGGFDISLTPSFSITTAVLLENGGIYAVANLRGGGEYGKAWHLAGTKAQKQNVFDDFQSAAEYLIENKYTNSDKLAIMGGSNGGLLVGACMTQRPDLYRVAIPRVGVLDMLRYHEFTIGWAWAEDYGRSDDPEAFEYLRKYSPLHNVKEVSYPATLIMTADHDDRVVPAHSFKFAAELQRKHQGDLPVIIRVETSAGHGAGKPTSKIIDESADMLSFMFFNMGEEITYPNLDS